MVPPTDARPEKKNAAQAIVCLKGVYAVAMDPIAMRERLVLQPDAYQRGRSVVGMDTIATRGKLVPRMGSVKLGVVVVAVVAVGVVPEKKHVVQVIVCLKGVSAAAMDTIATWERLVPRMGSVAEPAPRVAVTTILAQSLARPQQQREGLRRRLQMTTNLRLRQPRPRQRGPLRKRLRPMALMSSQCPRLRSVQERVLSQSRRRARLVQRLVCELLACQWSLGSSLPYH